jgi:protoporphyrinogen oxidase
MSHDSSQTTLVLGGGPAGLTAGYLLAREGRDTIVFEADDQVGGIAKTVERDGYRFDLGTRCSATSSCAGRACRASTGTTATSTIHSAGRT